MFSFELYNLLLWACTEVELNCKCIMEVNGAKPQGRCFTMIDYKKLEQFSKLSKYKAIYKNLRTRIGKGTTGDPLEYVEKEIRPFENFDSSISKFPTWYEAYNHVKHNGRLIWKRSPLKTVCMP